MVIKQNNHQLLAFSVGLALVGLGSIAPEADAAGLHRSLSFDQGADGGSVLYNSDGTLDTTQWSSIGLKNITGINNRKDRAAKFNTYDTALNTSRATDSTLRLSDQGPLRSSGLRDDDLRTGSAWGTEELGNVLIIQEENWDNTKFYNDNGYYRADDEASGGSINFEFDSKVIFESFSLIDVDDDGNSSKIKVSGGDFEINVGDLIAAHKTANGSSKGSTYTQDGVTITQMGTKRGNNSLYQFDLDQSYFAGFKAENIQFEYPGSGAIAGIEWSTEAEGPQEVPEPSAIGGLLMIGFIGKKLKQKRDLANVSELA